jgi:hypothetical protein
MKTYTVLGSYDGPALVTVKADSLLDALRKIRESNEDTLDLVDPSKFSYAEADVKQC